MYLKTSLHILIALSAATVFGLLAAGGVSCGGRPVAVVESPPSPDTLALVEGLRLFEEGRYDLAREQLSVSALSASTYIRAESFLYLNALEMESGNYDTARPWLEKYHAETVRLLRSAAEASARAAEQAARLRRRNDILAAGMIVVVILIAGATVLLTRRRRPEKKAHEGEGTPPAPEISGWGRWLDDAGRFQKTEIWDEIVALAAQKPGREARVLTLSRQEALDGELGEVFSDLAATLRADYPALTAGDVKLCCLSLLPLSSFGKALCWGSTETNIIKQRKHTIKKKLWGDERGRALFEFIFGERR